MMQMPRKTCLEAARLAAALDKAWTATLAFLCLACPVSIFAGAQSAPGSLAPRLTQYAHTAWKVRDGEIPAEPTSIAQTVDGYLWIGTQAGLLQFDGLRFRPSRIATEHGDHDFEVTALFGSKDGALWVGGKNHLGKLVGDTYHSFGYQGFITQFKSGRNGDTWFSRTRNPDSKGALCSVTGMTVHCYGKQEGLDCRYGNALVGDGGDGFWVGWDELCHWDGRSTVVLPFPKLKNDTGTMVADLIRKQNGNVLVGVDGAPPGMHPTETVAVVGDHVKVISQIDTLSPGNDIISMLVAHDGSEWIGTRQNGIYHVTTQRTDHYGASDGLSSDHVNFMLEDAENDIWIATTDGIDRLHVPKVLTFSSKEGLDVNNVSSVSPSSNGAVWIPTVNGLNVYRNDKVDQIALRDAGGGRQVLSVYQDVSGRVWIATSTHLLLYEAGKLSTVKQADGLPLLYPLRVVQDHANAIWVMPIWKKGDADLYRIDGKVAVPVRVNGKSDAREIEADPENGLWLRLLGDPDLYRFQNGSLSKAVVAPSGAQFTYFFPGRDGSIWALPEHGLMRWSKGKWKVLDTVTGLPCSSLLQLQFDSKGDLWLLSRCGLQEVSSSDLSNWVNDRTPVVQPKLFGASDGARVMNTNYLPHSTVTSDGKLWFGGDAGVQMIDPAAIGTNSRPPAVHIEEMIADGQEIPKGVRLRPLTHNIEIQYTALSLVSPERVQFKYRLLGSDKEWQQAYSRRQAFYQNLKPGKYTFEVIASNNDGVWNNTGDSLSFTIPPAFYQTSWFQGLIAFLALTLAWLVIRLREVRSAHAIEVRMRERLAERDRIARELHDTLLQGFQSIILRLHTVWSGMPKGEPASAMIEDTLTRADSVLRQGRGKVRDLRSEEPKQALSAELREYIAWNIQSYRGSCTVYEIGEPRSLSDAVRDDLAAIAKEALVNALTHANANVIVCELNFANKTFTLVCRDDGNGIDADVLSNGRPQRYGLLGMKERAERIGGRLRFDTASTTGTMITLEVPGRIAYVRSDDPAGWKEMTAWIRRSLAFDHNKRSQGDA